MAEDVAEVFVAAAQDPVDDFAFAHDVEVVHIEVAGDDHGMGNVGEELHAGAVFLGVIEGREGEIASGEVGGEVGILESKLVEAGFVLKDGEIIVERFNVVKSPDVVEEVAVGEGVFETIGSEIR